MKKLKILSIDDSKFVHKFLEQCLIKIADKFDTAINGEVAVSMLKKDINAYDLIFVDWEMPVKDGPSTIKELKLLGIKTPIIMLTTKNDPKDIAFILDLGVTDYVMKPFTQDIMESKINQLFS